jgi:hypothetical protein
MSSKKHEQHTEEMQREYEFSGGVRGKHFQAYQRGYKVVIHKEDGSTEERDFILPPGTVLLDPDVRAYFPDSEAVNRALRGLLDLVPRKQVTSKVLR